MINQDEILQSDLTPSQLDRQNKIPVNEWVDLDSPRARQVDDDYPLTIKWLKLAIEAGHIHVDSHGRLWGKDRDGTGFAPYHIEHMGSVIGYRVLKRAKN